MPLYSHTVKFVSHGANGAQTYTCAARQSGRELNWNNGVHVTKQSPIQSKVQQVLTTYRSVLSLHFNHSIILRLKLPDDFYLPLEPLWT
ncbi:hypothetical protein SCP_0900560 [Sparassis crispa]|uniref:Uncharacterized protein n=1 Tax=Sparassis crispa TaxID=139825 RepID=A0A401GVG7_9APHY|nr:hypothetical protein SCP_0900560 [Sparassis crispa]GBE86179.1 hypothetical protein SCP_0900560 [Sparassis crispa]